MSVPCTFHDYDKQENLFHPGENYFKNENNSNGQGQPANLYTCTTSHQICVQAVHCIQLNTCTDYSILSLTDSTYVQQYNVVFAPDNEKYRAINSLFEHGLYSYRIYNALYRFINTLSCLDTTMHIDH